ncbi:MAG TPA: helix-turn-helix transcriptional regulator [Polyangiaceae bacterium]|nr:helix-turn-helix transcriptional regulator [Polyangiaceae bacterium]
MTAPTLKLQYGAPLRTPSSRLGSPLAVTASAAARLTPTADVLRLGRAPNAAASASAPPVALCTGPDEPGPAPGPPRTGPEAPCEAPPPPASGAVCLEPAADPGAQCEPPSEPALATLTATCLEPAPEIEPHQLAAFAVALETLDAPAFLAKPNGEIGHANGAGRAWLERDRPGALACLQEARGGPKSHAFATTPVVFAAGAPPWHLVVVRPQDDREAERVARVAAASARWSLSARQREVLLLVVEGLSVPTIAAVLGCVEKTVGSHLNAIFKKALVESRAELTAKVWMG